MKVLKDWAQADRDAFERLYGSRGCTCFINPPCSHCMHPGHPLNQEEDEFWDEVFDLNEACEKAMERIKRQIDVSARKHADEGVALGLAIAYDMYDRHLKLARMEVAAHAEWVKHRRTRSRIVVF